MLLNLPNILRLGLSIWKQNKTLLYRMKNLPCAETLPDIKEVIMYKNSEQIREDRIVTTWFNQTSGPQLGYTYIPTKSPSALRDF